MKKIKNRSSIEELKEKYGIKKVIEENIPEDNFLLEVKKSKIGKTEIYIDGKLHGSQG